VRDARAHHSRENNETKQQQRCMQRRQLHLAAWPRTPSRLHGGPGPGAGIQPTPEGVSMKFKMFFATVAAAAACVLVAACGGGGGGGGPTAGGTIVLNGTAATGLAVASAPVSVRCAQGTGSATTDASGAYTVTVTNGALPCMVEVASVVDGQAVTLHSIAEAGTTNGSTTSARINVTPLTELIVATVLGSNPAAAFQSFGSQAVSPQQLAAASAAVLTAIRDALGVDLGSIDPFKSELVAATTSAPDAGNAYDKALDALAAKFNPRSLPLLVAQLVASGGTTPASLAGALATGPGCPSAVSGRYRSIALTGDTAVVSLDFKKMAASFEGGTGTAAIQPNPSQACQYDLVGAPIAAGSVYQFAISPQGAGAFSMREGLTRTQGYLFPVQAATLQDAAGTWLLARNGLLGTMRLRWFSQLTAQANGTAVVCDYDAGAGWTGACTPSGAMGKSLAAVDGALELHEGNELLARLWAFRPANGATTLFGTTNLDSAGTVRTSLLLSKQQPTVLPDVGAVTRSLNFRTIAGSPLQPEPLYATHYTVKSVDASQGSYVRNGTSAGVQTGDQTVILNAPQVGLRTLLLQTPQVQLLVPAAGLTLTVGTSVYNHIISVSLP
jgi:hypothetical protein